VEVTSDDPKNRKGFTRIHYYSYLIVHLLLYLCLIVHLLLYLRSSSSFIALFTCFKLFIAFTCRSEYIYRFIYIYYVLVNILCCYYPFPCVFGYDDAE
jgi:hypothetical protein